MDVPIRLTGIVSLWVGSSFDACSRIVSPSVTVPMPSGTISCSNFLISQTSFDVRHRRLLSILCGAHSAGSAGACSNVCFDIFCSCILALLHVLLPGVLNARSQGVSLVEILVARLNAAFDRGVIKRLLEREHAL